MITFGSNTRVYLAAGATDMLMPLRKSTTSRHRYTTGSSFEGRIIQGLLPCSVRWLMSPHPPHRKMQRIHRSVNECTTRYWQPEPPSVPSETVPGAWVAVRCFLDQYLLACIHRLRCEVMFRCILSNDFPRCRADLYVLEPVTLSFRQRSPFCYAHSLAPL